MRDPAYRAFWNALPDAALLADRGNVLDDFRHRYRAEIADVLTMLRRVGVFGDATHLHPDPPLACDICTAPIEERRWFVEGQIGEGTWATMCPRCFYEKGHSVGWGRGQLYWKVGDDRWRLVSGGDPEADDEGELKKV